MNYDREQLTSLQPSRHFDAVAVDVTESPWTLQTN